MMKILCYVGPWSDDYLENISKEMYPDGVSVLASLHKTVDQSGLVDEYYKNLKNNRNQAFDFKDEEKDIIERCRLLRSLSKKEALLHLNCMRDAVVQVFDKANPEIVISETIDSYVMDLFHRESLKRGILFIGLVNVFANGYFRISSRGEYNYLREPDEKEIQKFLCNIESTDYLPSFIKKTGNDLNLDVLKRWVRNAIKIPYFSIKRLTSGDYYNCHYWQTKMLAKECFQFMPPLNVGDKKWKEKLSTYDGTTIYVPLQMCPEATIDYWCEDLNIIDYERELLSFIAEHSDLCFLVKEHPNVVGYRSSDFYSKLEHLENVVFCPPEVASNSLKSSYDAVLVWTGTVGFECAIRGLPVLCYSHPYYFPSENFYQHINSKTTSSEIREYIDQHPKSISQESKEQLARHVLSCIDYGKLMVDGSWSLKSNMLEMEQISKSIKKYIERKNANH
ncbi:hypothetical protein M3P05_19125 [Sansalvadorimonas sp. 2012CJ34-2]|uniref:Capsule polysaccharide biosynthesis protein n=1 Tax=Parendozoicomonas callyspongiae TaxID=2942213 RepID=A0ABT0PNK3_9GAMM|nr:hypothetical protein [Sansalvadorimonas sp. 2012CJ34-2]MCL6272038.1 hypothetical protein [Sansalvadorimonas sp. 2012CJ34-2]